MYFFIVSFIPGGLMVCEMKWNIPIWKTIKCQSDYKNPLPYYVLDLHLRWLVDETIQEVAPRSLEGDNVLRNSGIDLL